MTLKAKHNQTEKAKWDSKREACRITVFRQSENKVQKQVFGLICKNLD